MPPLVAQIGDVTGMMLTFDALHCQQDTARLIHQAGAHYLLAVKANQPGLLARVAALPWDQVSDHIVTDLDHGRTVTRSH